MNVLKKMRDKCAKGIYKIAISKYKRGIGPLCLYLTYYEPDFIQELILDEE